MQKLFLLPAIFVVVSASTCNTGEITKGVDNVLRTYEDSGFSGVALIVKDKKILLQKGYGYADREKKILNHTKTLFNVASVGKQFTAVIVLKLHEQGKLSINDKVSKYTGPLHGEKEAATIENLLLHNSGLFIEGSTMDYSSREGFIESLRNGGHESKPGERHRYSNAGYSLLAAIVEIVTKKPFEQVLKEMIFQPMGMQYTGFPWEAHIQKDLLATGYNSKGEAVPAETDIWANRGPGNLVTNTEDMKHWFRAWHDEKLISTWIKNKMLTDHIPGKESFAWNKSIERNRIQFYSKGGGRADFESQTIWYPEKDIYIFFSINADKNLRRLIYRDVTEYMAGR
jgi:CubicO group peptidase (beta-lactamase class C family)